VPHFIVADHKTDYLLRPSMDDWLNDDHLARFVAAQLLGYFRPSPAK
jgi:hypothetical protein